MMTTLNVTDITIVLGYLVENIYNIRDVLELENHLIKKGFKKSSSGFVYTYHNPEYKNHNKKTLILSEAGGHIIQVSFLEAA